MGKSPAFDTPKAISKILFSDDYDQRRSNFLEFVSFIFHPQDSALRILDRDVLMLKYFVHQSMRVTEQTLVTASFKEAKEYIARLSAVIFHKDLFSSFLGNNHYSDYQLLIADIVRFILVYDDKPSIKKAHFFLSKLGGFKHPKSPLEWRHYVPTEALFNKRWNAWKSVCPFHFADVYVYKRQIAYLPLSDSLDIYVDKLLKDETGLKEYFETALKVANLLREKLDLRTFKGKHHLAAFPQGLSPHMKPLAKLTDAQLTKMSKYRIA